MSTPSSANTPASSRSSRTTAAQSSASKSIYTSPIVHSEIPIQQTKRSLDYPTDSRVPNHGPRPARRIFSESTKARFDIRNRMPASRDSGGFLLEPLSVLAKGRYSIEHRKTEQSGPSTSQQWNGDDSHKTEHARKISLQDDACSQDNAIASSKSSQPSTNGYVLSTPDTKGKGRASPLQDRAIMKSDDIARTSPTGDILENSRVSDQSSRHYHDVMDPTQIIQMALSLSESRRLHLSPGHLAPTAIPGSRRVMSAGFAPPAAGWQASAHSARGGSLSLPRQQPKNRLDDSLVHEPDERSLFPHFVNASTNTQHTAASLTRPNELQFNYSFTAATISRAEKARIYFELSHEYRRLLAYLPPLKAHAELSGQQVLGRAYNPLQYIRNRQVRSRERQNLDVKSTGWNNVDIVKLWVDTVEVESSNEDNRSGDVLILPPWNEKLRASGVQSSAPWLPPDPPEPSGSSAKAKWAKLDWSITPADLLADAYWLEQESNKSLIETRSGARIFDTFHRPRPLSPSTERLRKSTELSNDMTPHVTESPGSTKHSQSPTSPPGRRSDVMEGSRFRRSSSPPQKRSKVSRVKRRLLRRHKDEAETSFDSEVSDLDHPDIEDFDKHGPPRFENTGPLEKHMNKMLELEHRNKTGKRTRRFSSIESDPHARRGGVSAEYAADTGHQQQRSSTDMMSDRPSFDAYHTETPRISIEDTDAVSGALSKETTADLDDRASKADVEDAMSSKKHHSNPLSFLRKASKTKEKEKIEETDFANVNNDDLFRNSISEAQLHASPRSSLESMTRSNSHLSSNYAQSRRDAQSKSQDDLSRSTKFFKGGRIGEIVRSERPRGGGFVWKRRAPGKGSKGLSKMDLSFSESEDDDNVHLIVPNVRESRRSQSATDLSQGAYRGKMLPAFKPILARASTKDEGVRRPATGDHISRQANAQRAQNRRSRFDRMAPLSVQTSRPTSPTSISRLTSREKSERPQDRQDRNRDRSPGDNRSSSRSRSGVRSADKRLNAILRAPGGVGTGGLPVTGLSAIEARRRSRSAATDGHRHWSIADGAGKLEQSSIATVTAREVAYVRTLLLASGVKAKAIVLKANEPRDSLPEFLIQAAKITKTSLGNVGRRQEHVLAARMLSRNLEDTISSFEKAAERFRGETCAQLHSRIDDLREQVGSKLTPLVRSCGDDADAFIAQLTTTHTLAIKQVNDSVELMMRSRRKRLRWLRKAGFALLEWVLVGLMWWIWLFVYALKVVRGLIMGLWRFIRWFF